LYYSRIPWGYIQQLDEEAVDILRRIAGELRIAAYRAMTAIHANATDTGYSSPESDESDALGNEWAVVAPKHRVSTPAFTS
jgi:hypothetical protein